MNIQKILTIIIFVWLIALTLWLIGMQRINDKQSDLIKSNNDTITEMLDVLAE
jgi:ATP/ADP translocase